MRTGLHLCKKIPPFRALAIPCELLHKGYLDPKPPDKAGLQPAASLEKSLLELHLKYLRNSRVWCASGGIRRRLGSLGLFMVMYMNPDSRRSRRTSMIREPTSRRSGSCDRSMKGLPLRKLAPTPGLIVANTDSSHVSRSARLVSIFEVTAALTDRFNNGERSRR